MTENENVTSGGETEAAGPTRTGEDPWKEVVRSLDDFGSAVTEWGAAVRDDPENRRRMKELQASLESMGKSVGEMADSAVKSDVGKEMRSAFVATGEVVASSAKRVTDEVSPFVAGAFRTAAGIMHEAAQRIEKKATESGTVSGPAQVDVTVVAPVPGTPESGPMGDEEPPHARPSDASEDYVP